MFTIIGGDGREYGPVSAEQLRLWMAENRVNLDTQAKRVGSADWLPLRQFPEFAAAAPLPGVAGVPTMPPNLGQTPPEPIQFTGEWTEFFKIWIVNLLLTVVTLGLYAAWAKVRTRRYFCANTRIFGHAFEYLADPKKILYGNLIVGAIFAAYVGLGVVMPLLQAAFTLLFAIAVPWFIVRALTFNARNTAWRGLRFNFTGTYGQAASVFLVWPMLMPFTLGLIYPLISKKRKEFIVNHTTYGTTPFAFAGETGTFYKIYGVAFLFFLPIIVGYIAVFATLIAAGFQRGAGGAGQPPSPMMGLFGLVILAGVPFAIAGGLYLRARLFNYVWNNTSLAGNQFVASMRARDLFVLQLVNSIVTLVTLGLLHPWAVVRTVKYQLSCLQVQPAGNIDAFVATAQEQVGALGDAASDFFDLDLGFGL